MFEILTLMWKIFLGFSASIVRLFWTKKPKSIRGEVALITGAGHGLGQQMCLRFAELGATIIAVDVNPSANDETLQMLKQNGANVYAYTADLRSRDEIRKLASQIRDEVGDVTMLVNNAGVIYPTDILSLTEDMISNTFNVNIFAHFWLIQEFLPYMKKRNHGHIIATASYAGLFGAAFMTDYSATKHAVVGLMEALRNELLRQKFFGVKVTCVCPGFVKTGFVKNIRSKAKIPILTPEEVVDAAMKGILRDQSLVTIPPAFLRFFRDLVPHSVMDAVNAHVSAEVDLVK